MIGGSQHDDDGGIIPRALGSVFDALYAQQACVSIFQRPYSRMIC
jgi:hypothetical protein